MDEIRCENHARFDCIDTNSSHVENPPIEINPAQTRETQKEKNPFVLQKQKEGVVMEKIVKAFYRELAKPNKPRILRTPVSRFRENLNKINEISNNNRRQAGLSPPSYSKLSVFPDRFFNLLN